MTFEADNKEKNLDLFSRRTQLFVFEKMWKKVMTQAKLRPCHRRRQYVTLVVFACSNYYGSFTCSTKQLHRNLRTCNVTVWYSNKICTWKL